MSATLTHRLARSEDRPGLAALMEAAITELQRPWLGPAEIAASRASTANWWRTAATSSSSTGAGSSAAAAGAGAQLYRACGYEAVERLGDDRGGAPVPLVRTVKPLA